MGLARLFIFFIPLFVFLNPVSAQLFSAYPSGARGYDWSLKATIAVIGGIFVVFFLAFVFCYIKYKYRLRSQRKDELRETPVTGVACEVPNTATVSVASARA